MNNEILIQKISRLLVLPENSTKEFIHLATVGIVSELTKYDSIELPSFGKFEVKNLSDTGKKILTFKPAKELLD